MAIIRQSSSSHQAVIRQFAGSFQVAIMLLLGIYLIACNILFLTYCEAQKSSINLVMPIRKPFYFKGFLVCFRLYRVFQLDLPQNKHLLGHQKHTFKSKNEICTFMRCGILTYDPWILLKITSKGLHSLQQKKCQKSIK